MSGDVIREAFIKILSYYDEELEELELRCANAGEDDLIVNECVMTHKVLCKGFDWLLDNLRNMMSNDDNEDAGYSSDE